MRIEEYQKIEKEILKKIKKVCNENNIVYYIASGTLLGAIRHKNLIPWDDDIDIWMTREEFEKLKKLPDKVWGEEMCLDFGNDDVFCDFTPRIIYKKYKVYSLQYEELGDAECLKYPFIDIFILDNEFDNYLLKKIRLLLLIITYGKALGHRKSINYKKYTIILRPLIFVLSHIGKNCKLETIRRKYEFYSQLCKNKNSKCYIAANDTFPRDFSLNYKKEYFKKKIELNLGDDKFSAPARL